MLDGDKSTVLITGLKPNTKYVFTVRAVYGDALGESAAVKGKTSECLFSSHPCVLLVPVGTETPPPKTTHMRSEGWKGGNG